jgi:hypothetical protein
MKKLRQAALVTGMTALLFSSTALTVSAQGLESEFIETHTLTAIDDRLIHVNLISAFDGEILTSYFDLETGYLRSFDTKGVLVAERPIGDISELERIIEANIAATSPIRAFSEEFDRSIIETRGFGTGEGGWLDIETGEMHLIDSENEARVIFLEEDELQETLESWGYTLNDAGNFVFEGEGVQSRNTSMWWRQFHAPMLRRANAPSQGEVARGWGWIRPHTRINLHLTRLQFPLQTMDAHVTNPWGDDRWTWIDIRPSMIMHFSPRWAAFDDYRLLVSQFHSNVNPPSIGEFFSFSD